MDVLIELNYTPEFLQSCNFCVDVLAYELADYRHVGFHSDDEDFNINVYVFLDRVWTFGMYASYHIVWTFGLYSCDAVFCFMFYNGYLIRAFFNHELPEYSWQTIRCSGLYISILGHSHIYRIFSNGIVEQSVKNYILIITMNKHNTEMLREAIKSNKFPDIFYNFNSITREDARKYINSVISRADDVNYIDDIHIYDDVLPNSQLEVHDFKYELLV
jgi:hypothetical protein